MQPHASSSRSGTPIDADQDGRIDDGEMNRWFFALFDADDDGTISKEEWRLAEIYFDVPVL